MYACRLNGKHEDAGCDEFKRVTELLLLFLCRTTICVVAKYHEGEEKAY